ncbi:MAG TPA: glutathione S-transferase N-terminal domain-containing protein [Steroidobacteraceae bacterium]|jgi:glutathione S-transferase|nr:glutathione S-transferase N-terminal domain-containing protein [Steroidobacteraceae bacterium]
MKLYYSATSPFVRKCLACAQELGLTDRLELIPAVAHPVDRDRTLVSLNPLGKVPTLVTDEGAVLYDSRVICEYLNALGGGTLLPAHGASRWSVLTDQALADGILDAAVLTRYETAVRPENLRWKEWVAGQLDKVTCGLAAIEPRARGFADRVDLGTIALGCALGYLDFRYASLAWREKHPDTAVWFDRFGKRDSMMSTRPPAT